MGELPTDIIQRLLKVIPNLMLEPGDARPLLPPIYNIGVTIPFELSHGTASDSPQSSLNPIIIDKAPNTGATVSALIEIGAGLYIIEWSVSAIADFVAGDVEVRLNRARDGAIVNVEFIGLLVANTEFYRVRRFPLLIREGYLFQHVIPATGVGQNIHVRGGLSVSRIL